MKNLIPTLLFASLLGGCNRGAEAEGRDLSLLTENARQKLSGCAALSGGLWDQCALSVLEQSQGSYAGVGMTGPGAMRVCEIMKDQGAQDLCWEFVVRLNLTVPGEACENIQDMRIRGSCRLSVADRIIFGPYVTFEQVLALCPTLEEMEPHCWTHWANAWHSRWQQTGMTELRHDLAEVVDTVRDPASLATMPLTIGYMAADVPNPFGTNPCDVLPTPEYRSECLDALVKRVNSINGGGMGAPASFGQAPRVQVGG